MECGIKKNLTRVEEGVYLSKNDPDYWIKYAQYFPNENYGLLKAGETYNLKAEKSLQKYYKYKKNEDFELYEKLKNLAIFNARKSYIKGNKDAEKLIWGLMEEMESTERKIVLSKMEKRYKILLNIFICEIILLALIIICIGFNQL